MKKVAIILSTLFLSLTLVSCNEGGSIDTPSGGGGGKPTHTHEFIDVARVEPTCQSEGNIAYSYCEGCGKYFDINHQEEISKNSIKLAKIPHQLEHHAGVLFETLESWTCSMCHKTFLDENGKFEASSLDAHDVHKIANENVETYLLSETEEEQVIALKDRSLYNDQIKKTLTWPANATCNYIVELSTTEDFSTFKKYKSNTNSITLPGTLIPGTKYYWRVKDNDNNIVCNTRGFEVDGSITTRLITIEGVSNVRDMGGWTAKDGNVIPYGKLYRGARLTNITSQGIKTMLDDLGIKTEIDLRAGADGVKEINDIRLDYTKCGFDQYTMIVPGYTTPEIQGRPGSHYGHNSTIIPGLQKIFNILANPNNYPIYFHCNAGADRTGTLAYLINGLLGVSYEDLTRDFELTTFSSQGNRFRGPVDEETGLFATEDDEDNHVYKGIYECDTSNYIAWGKLHELITTHYAYDDGELSSAIALYLKKVCDIPEKIIQAVRNNLLGKKVDFPEVEVKIDKTFTLDNLNLSKSTYVGYEKGDFLGKENVYKFV